MMSLVLIALGGMVALGMTGCQVPAPESDAHWIEAADFGLHADGVTNDGPVLRRMLEAARAVDGPVKLRFPPAARIFVATGEEQYALRLDRMNDVTLDGQGSTFLLDASDLRFLHATACRNLRVQRLQVDVFPPPVVETKVLEVPDAQTLRVWLDDPSEAERVGGASGAEDEQSFFGMLWWTGRYATETAHVSPQSFRPVPDADRPGAVLDVRLSRPIPADTLARATASTMRLSLPVPGVAHRYGGSSMIRIDRCTDVQLEAVEVWSAPWFAFEIFRNDGDLIFQRVHVRPPPDSGRLTSSWRDAFHVKGNRGRLLFEDCMLQGMHDDSFNVSTHTWIVTGLLAEDRVRIAQDFPIQFIPPQVGGKAHFVCPVAGQILGTARIKRVEGLPFDDTVYLPGDHQAPELILHLEQGLDAVVLGAQVWDLSVANPDTTIRRCYLGNSARFRSPVTVEDCEVDALLFFASEDVEGPLPAGSIVRNSTLRQGRGNPEYAVVFNGWTDRPAGRSQTDLPPGGVFPLHTIRLENNDIFGGILIDKVRDATLVGNRLHEGPAAVRIVNPPPDGD